MKEKIATLWRQLPNDGTKANFIDHCAKKFNRSPKTIKTYWFSKSGLWSVPIDFQREVANDLDIEVKKHLKS